MVGPALAFCAVRVVDIHAAALTAIPGDNLVIAVAVQVRGQNRVALIQRVVDHLPLPHLLVVLPVDRNLIAVPRLDRRQHSYPGGLASQPSYRYVARS